MTMTMTLLFYTVTMAMVVTVLSLRECEQTADVVQFRYACLDNRLVNPCFQGRHLRIAQPECVGEVDEANICDKCTTGFIEGSNFCNECNRWTECGPDEMEDPENPPSAIRDRTCIPKPPPPESSSHSPPSEFSTQPTCPSCPECPTLDPSITSTADGAEGPGTSYVPLPDSDISTAPQGGTSTVGPLPRGMDNNDVDVWKGVAIFLFILNIIQFIIWPLVVWRCCQRKRKHPKNEGAVQCKLPNGYVELPLPDPGNGCGQTSDFEVQMPPECPEGATASSPEAAPDPASSATPPKSVVQNKASNVDVKVSLQDPGNGCGQTSDLKVQLPSERSEGATSRSPGAAQNPATNAEPAESTGQPEWANNIPSSSEVAPSADEDSFEDETSPLRDPQEARADNDAAGSSRVSSSPHRRRAPPVRDGYRVGGETPSQQSLLGGNDTMASEVPTNEFQQSVPATNSTNHVGDSTESLQSRPNGTAWHEAPTAPYVESQSTSPSHKYRAFEKAEVACEMTTLCTDDHADYVKDNIDIDTHIDFYFKLGLSKKDYGPTMYDHKHEGIQEQIRHVIIDVFIKKKDDPSIDKLLSALDNSGNKDVCRGFKKKFQVTCTAGC